jgi:hypothetical protein
MSLPDGLRTFADALDHMGSDLAALAALTQTTTDDKAVAVLRLVAAGLSAVVSDLGIAIDPAAVQKRIDDMHAQISANDSATAADIDAKFPSG